MTESEEMANAISCFIEKHGTHLNTQLIELPKGEFTIKRVCKVGIDANSLKKVSNLWTFEGTAEISYTADASKVTLSKKSVIIGNANIKYNSNAVNQNEKYFDVMHVTISVIK